MRINSTTLLIVLLITLSLGSCQNYVANTYQGGSFSFSDTITVWTNGASLTIYNNSQLDLPPTNYTAQNQIYYTTVLPNGQILFTSYNYQVLDPSTLKIVTSGSFSPYNLYTFNFGVNSDTFFYSPRWYSTQMYYVNTTTGKSFLLDPSFTENKLLLYLSTTQILIANSQDSSFVIKSLVDNSILYTGTQTSEPLMDFGATDYQIFYLIIKNGIQVWSFANYNLLFQETYSSNVKQAWMPNSGNFLVYTGDGVLSIYSSAGFTIGSINLGTDQASFTYLNAGLLAVQVGDSTINIYNITNTANFFYASFNVPNLISESLMYLESSLFAGITSNQVLVFDYSLETLVRNITFTQQLTSLLAYVSGSFFLAENAFNTYLSTCHYSCLTCSQLGQDYCASCSSNRFLSTTDSTCSCLNATCPADQNPCFLCGDEISAFASEPNWQSSSTVTSTSTSTSTTTSTTTTTTPISTTTSTETSTPTSASSSSTSSTSSTSGTSSTSSSTSKTSTTTSSSTSSTTTTTSQASKTSTSSTKTTKTTSTSSSTTTTTSSSSTTSSSTSTTTSTTTSTPTPNANITNTTTQGTGQNAVTINYLQAVDVGLYATKQTINIYMLKQVAVYYLITVQGTNIAGQDSCSYIKQSATQSSNSCYVSMDVPTDYGETDITYYQSSPQNPNYVLSFYGLRGATTYFVKICGDSGDDNDYQTLTFTTMNNNYKVAIFQFYLSVPVNTNLTQDFLCYLTNLLNFPSNRLYSLDGSQCNQIVSNLVASPEIYEKGSPPNRRRLDSTTINGTASSSSASYPLGVIFYGNAYSESPDDSVDEAMSQLSSYSGSSTSLTFSDQAGDMVSVNSIIYQGTLTSDTPVLSNNITIESTPDSVALSDVVIENMSGFVYAMISPQVNNQTAPTQAQIKNSSNATQNSSDNSANTSYYWYYDGQDPVTISFQSLYSSQAYTVYYFASNEDLSNFAKYTPVYSKTIQTGGTLRSTSLLIGVIVVTILIFITLLAVAVWCIRRPKRSAKASKYKANINHTSSAQITVKPNEVLDTQVVKVDKDEPFHRMMIDLDGRSPASQDSKLNAKQIEEISVEVIQPNPFDTIQQKIDDLEKKVGYLELEKLCPNCKEHPKDVLLGCGHIVCSVNCVMLRKCPIDGITINSRKKLY